MSQKSIEILDTSLRDGCQTVNVSLTLKDKIRIAQALDDIGVDIIEGGWPGSNPKDVEFFSAMKKVRLNTSKVAAFGSTKRKDVKASQDANLNAIVRTEADVAVIFGKSWTLHVDEVLKVGREDNLDLISESVSFLKSSGFKVIYDAEHFYQGYDEDKEYALRTLAAAEEAKADVIALADTNGGTIPSRVFEVTGEVAKSIKTRLGVHMHNDIGCGTANSVMGVLAGATHVQGTINGIGERTGNADLIQIIPTLVLKLGFNVLKRKESLKELRSTSRLVYELTGIAPDPYQPYVGENAFGHKGGIHVDAMLKNTRAYEHIDPSLVGNSRNVVISELSGTSNLVTHAVEVLQVDVKKNDKRLKQALIEIKELERDGYSFDSSLASALLVVMKALGLYRRFINLEYWRVMSESGLSVGLVKTNSTLHVAEGTGPIHAVDLALREALLKEHPELSRISLLDYRVILPGEVKNTESVVRVTVEFSDSVKRWRTMGVSSNVIDASVKALVDGLDYYLQFENLARMRVRRSASRIRSTRRS